MKEWEKFIVVVFFFFVMFAMLTLFWAVICVYWFQWDSLSPDASRMSLIGIVAIDLILTYLLMKRISKESVDEEK